MSALDSCVTATTSFALVINFIYSQWVPYHVRVGLFETIDTSRVVMATQVKELLSLYNLLNKLIAYVKDKCRNPSLGLTTKARVCKVASQEGSRESHNIFPRV
jgi:hypothetical protein